MADSKSHQFQPKTVDHISYAVKDIERVVADWSRLYGIGPWTYREKMEIELVQCVEGRIFQSRFLDTWGEGLHHIGFFVDDVDAETANLVAQGAKLFIHDRGNFAYLDAGGAGGAIFELMQRRD